MTLRALPWTVAAVAAFGIAAAAVEPEFSAERVKAHVAFLADDLLEGRETGTRGHELAARYVAAQLALQGVAPAGDGGSYLDPVMLLEASPSGATPTVVLTTPRGTTTLTHLTNVVVRGPLDGGTGTVTAPVVFAGYGISDPTLRIDDYAGLDVKGKIVALLNGAPNGFDSEIAAHLTAQQYRVAAEHGAIGVLSVMTRSMRKVRPWTAVTAEGQRPSTTWVQRNGTPFDPTYGIKVRALLDATSSAALFAGAPRTLEQVLDEADSATGRPKGFALPATAAMAATTTTRRFSSPEVIAVIEGSDPALKNEYVTLMAHADHLGMMPSGSGDRIYNGALDNAAGVAMLLEVARALAEADPRPRRSVLVVANTAEEKGLLGAGAFAAHPPVPIERITAAIDLDMPMLLYNFTDAVAYGASHSTIDAAFRQAGAAMGVTLSPDPMPEQAVFVRSDHYEMAKRGVPAVMLATGMANGGAAAWQTFLDKRYHQVSDDLTQPIVWSAGARFAELNYRAVRILADADTRAQWYAGDYFGTLFAPSAAKAAKPATPARR